MRKIARGGGEFEPYRPWSAERRHAVRMRRSERMAELRIDDLFTWVELVDGAEQFARFNENRVSSARRDLEILTADAAAHAERTGMRVRLARFRRLVTPLVEFESVSSKPLLDQSDKEDT